MVLQLSPRSRTNQCRLAVQVDEQTVGEAGWLCGTYCGSRGWFPQSYAERCVGPSASRALPSSPGRTSGQPPPLNSRWEWLSCLCSPPIGCHEVLSLFFVLGFRLRHTELLRRQGFTGECQWSSRTLFRWEKHSPRRVWGHLLRNSEWQKNKWLSKIFRYHFYLVTKMETPLVMSEVTSLQVQAEWL